MSTGDVWAVPGQERAAQVLRRAVERDEVGHAWALTGPADVGQEALTRALVAALVCRRDPSGCGDCPACHRALAGTHPAGTEFRPTGAFHRVADVRERWVAAASRSPGEGGWKVLHVVDADRMNEAAANAFLKVLEEPPPHTVWVLDMADPESLPETVLSRCRAVGLRSLGRTVLESEAARLGLDDPGDRALAVRACLGSVTRLGELAQPGGLEAVRAHRRIPRRLREDGPGHALVAAHELEGEAKARGDALDRERAEDREALEQAHGGAPPRALLREIDDARTREVREARTAALQAGLDDLACWYRDVLVVQRGGDPSEAVHADDPDGVRADAAALPAVVVLGSLDEVLAAREALEMNAQPRLALEACLLTLATLAQTSG